VSARCPPSGVHIADVTTFVSPLASAIHALESTVTPSASAPSPTVPGRSQTGTDTASRVGTKAASASSYEARRTPDHARLITVTSPWANNLHTRR